MFCLGRLPSRRRFCIHQKKGSTRHSLRRHIQRICSKPQITVLVKCQNINLYFLLRKKGNKFKLCETFQSLNKVCNSLYLAAFFIRQSANIYRSGRQPTFRTFRENLQGRGLQNGNYKQIITFGMNKTYLSKNQSPSVTKEMHRLSWMAAKKDAKTKTSPDSLKASHFTKICSGHSETDLLTKK